VERHVYSRTVAKYNTRFLNLLRFGFAYIFCMPVKQKVNHTNRYAVIDWASLTMLLTLFFNILINLMIIRSFQCEFVSSNIYTIVIATPFRKQKEDYWTLELGSAAPYDCNDKIVDQWMWCIFSTPVTGMNDAMVIAIIQHISYAHMMFH
jgi:hypothetical protein